MAGSITCRGHYVRDIVVRDIKDKAMYNEHNKVEVITQISWDSIIHAIEKTASKFALSSEGHKWFSDLDIFRLEKVIKRLKEMKKEGK